MDNFNISLNLLRIKGAKVVTSKIGHKVLCIDLSATTPALSYNANKGTAYLFLNAWFNHDKSGNPVLDEYGQSHIVRPSVSMKARESGSADKAILGNMKPISTKSEPRFSSAPSNQDFEDGLPF